MARASGKKNDEIGMVMVALPGCRCRCGHEWVPRTPGERPLVCPKCKSPRWDRPKLFERAKK
jgi:predicted Zn-ribbon and HTH transcriptional regulator